MMFAFERDRAMFYIMRYFFTAVRANMTLRDEIMEESLKGHLELFGLLIQLLFSPMSILWDFSIAAL